MVERIGIFGASGSGKTSCLFHAVKKPARVLFFDPLGEAMDAAWKRQGWKVFHTMRELKAAVAKSPARYKFAYQPKPGFELDELNEFSGYAHQLQKDFKRHKVELTFAVDELNMSFPLHSDQKSPNFAGLCSRGRHFGINLIGVSQGVAEVGMRFRRNLSTAFILRQMGEPDEKAAAALTGQSRAAIQALQNYDVMVFREGKVTKSRTVPIS